MEMNCHVHSTALSIVRLKCEKVNLPEAATCACIRFRPQSDVPETHLFETNCSPVKLSVVRACLVVMRSFVQNLPCLV